MKKMWMVGVKLIAIAVFCFVWFGILIPFLINTPDDLMVGIGFLGYPVGLMLAVTLVWGTFKQPLVRLYQSLKEGLE